jgi:hypothetical protein
LFEIGYETIWKFLICNAHCFPYVVYESCGKQTVIEPNITNKLKVPLEIRKLIDGHKMSIQELEMASDYLDQVISKNLIN